VPVKTVATKDGAVKVVTVFDLLIASYGIDRGLGGENVAADYDADEPGTPAWAEAITGVPRAEIIGIARGFAANAEKTEGRSMVILGAGLNHWFHMDMAYRGIINLLMMCGAIGRSGGGGAHYVGQEKLRPQTGWTVLAFALDWYRPPRQVNSTSFFYLHSSQWRYEKLTPQEIASPLADSAALPRTLIDCNAMAERLGWLPSAPALRESPLAIAAAAAAAGQEVGDYVATGLATGRLAFAHEDPDAPENFPRNMFIWRSNLLGSSGKGHEYFLKYLLGSDSGVLGPELDEEGGAKPEGVRWRADAATGKLDLLVTLDFRMSTTCLYSDIVLPTAT
jgi:nitrate reductase / nitrite oxidoreductase, alpha subunit